MKRKYKKYTNLYMEYLEQNHERYSKTKKLRGYKLKDFINIGYRSCVARAIK